MLRRFSLILVLTLVIGITATMVFAAEEGAAEPALRQQTLLDTINAGGTIGYIIMLLGVVALALSIENFLSMRRAVVMPPLVLADVEECFEKEEYEQAITICEEQPTFFTNVVAAGLGRVSSGYAQMEEAMADASDEASTKLQQKLGLLNLIANIAPMLGLLGTVQGMISAFQKIAMSGAPRPDELANSIQLALVTTAQGLIVAIPIMCIHLFLKNKVQKMVLEVGAVKNELMARFKPVE